MKITFTCENLSNTRTIYRVLEDKLGRTPSNLELKQEVRRIMDEALIDAAGKGKLRHQRVG